MREIPNHTMLSDLREVLRTMVSRAARFVEGAAGRLAEHTERKPHRRRVGPGAERVYARHKKTVDPSRKRRYNKPKQTT